MNRDTAVKKLIGMKLSRNEANRYLDEMHAFGLNNEDCIVNREYELATGMSNTILVPYRLLDEEEKQKFKDIGDEVASDTNQKFVEVGNEEVVVYG